MAAKQKSADAEAVASAKDRKVRSARGAEARNKLKKAAENVLERIGYHQMRVADVTREAGVASSLFYHYFPDLKTMVLEVLTDFLHRFEEFDVIEKGVTKGDWYGAILAHNRLYVEHYSKHPGIMRCLLRVSDEVPEFGTLFSQSLVRQLKWMTNTLMHKFPDAQLTEQEALHFVYSLSGTAEMLLRGYYISRDSALTGKATTNAEMAELISVIMYRALFLESPPLDKLHYTKKFDKVKGTH